LVRASFFSPVNEVFSNFVGIVFSNSHVNKLCDVPTWWFLLFHRSYDSMRFASKNNQLNQVAHNLCNWLIAIFTSYFLIIPNNHFSMSLGVNPQLSKDFPWCHIFSLLLEWRLYRGIPSTYLRYWAERCHNAASYAGNLFKVLYILFTSIDVLQKSIV
jgi:hypothetical protein